VYINILFTSGRNRSSQSHNAAAVRQVRTDGQTACGAFKIESRVREKWGDTFEGKNELFCRQSSAHETILFYYYSIYISDELSNDKRRSVESFSGRPRSSLAQSFPNVIESETTPMHRTPRRRVATYILR